MKGFKVFNPDFTCRGFIYEVGKDYTHEGSFSPCNSGFHFCEKLIDCFNYYPWEKGSTNRVAEVEAIGEVKTEGDKSCTNHITIIREISWQEVLDAVNTGKGNTGRGNAGHYNAGHYNAGHYNAGHYNAGRNNAGDNNAGHYNAGHYNAGSFNACNHSAGDFCTVEPPYMLFNKPSLASREDVQNSRAWRICRQLRVVDDECNKIEYKQAWANLWASLSNSEKITVQTLTNFDAAIFFELSGIQV